MALCNQRQKDRYKRWDTYLLIVTLKCFLVVQHLDGLRIGPALDLGDEVDAPGQ